MVTVCGTSTRTLHISLPFQIRTANLKSSQILFGVSIKCSNICPTVAFSLKAYTEILFACVRAKFGSCLLYIQCPPKARPRLSSNPIRSIFVNLVKVSSPPLRLLFNIVHLVNGNDMRTSGAGRWEKWDEDMRKTRGRLDK